MLTFRIFHLSTQTHTYRHSMVPHQFIFFRFSIETRTKLNLSQVNSQDRWRTNFFFKPNWMSWLNRSQHPNARSNFFLHSFSLRFNTITIQNWLQNKVDNHHYPCILLNWMFQLLNKKSSSPFESFLLSIICWQFQYHMPFSLKSLSIVQVHIETIKKRENVAEQKCDSFFLFGKVFYRFFESTSFIFP